jgi:steroid 5-alpha reductase family enzyme
MTGLHFYNENSTFDHMKASDFSARTEINLKMASLIIIGAVYVVACIAGICLFQLLIRSIPEIPALLGADFLATLVVWGAGIKWRNVSVYDPYWSVAPPVILTIWAFYKHCFTLPVALLLVAVWYWGTRLTLNWAGTFKSLAYEDWRYTRYRKNLSPFRFHLVNLFGLNYFPTLIVFACMLPGLGVFDSHAPADAWTWVGFTMCIAAPTIQLVADRQIHIFRAEHPGRYCDTGLWKHGRHPNYFGEILMWWGVWVMYVSLEGFAKHPLYVLAPIAMTAMFLFISIPMMERRQLQNKPGYAEYRRRTRILI